MNILSLNIRGVDSYSKQSWVKELCRSKKVHFLTLQETMVASVDEKVTRAFWGNLGYEFLCLSSNGKSGGIVSIWEALSFTMLDFIKGDGFLLIKGVWLNPASYIGIFSVYAPHQLLRKKNFGRILSR